MKPEPFDVTVKSTPASDPALDSATDSALPDYGHLMDYVLDLHIIVGPNGMCRCGEDGITCSERLRCVSHEIGSALLGAHMTKSMGGTKFTPNVELSDSHREKP
jgi:hypothetical protein